MKNFTAACLASVLVYTVTARKANLKLSNEDLVFEESWTDERPESARESHERRHHIDVLIDENKRPVFGVLTEPIRGQMYTKRVHHTGEDIPIEGNMSYVPRAHVQFLEQAGIRVVPVDYRLPAEERFALMDELSGLYLPGDSTTSILDDAYKSAFIDTLIYLEESVQIKKEHFPVFMMGNSLQTLVRARQESVNTLKPMEDLRNEMLMVEMLGMPSDSYFFNGMDREEKQAVFNTGTFFNRQSSGLRLRELAKDAELFKMLEPLATFISASESEEDQFIAIAEAHNLPLYVFTYGLEMTQFYFEDPTLNNDEYLLDHSLVARTHSQFIANTIADEGRQSVHEFADPSSVYDKLIIHKPLMSVVYQNMDTDLSTTMPAGMSEHEIYLLQ